MQKLLPATGRPALAHDLHHPAVRPLPVAVGELLLGVIAHDVMELGPVDASEHERAVDEDPERPLNLQKSTAQNQNSNACDTETVSALGLT